MCFPSFAATGLGDRDFAFGLLRPSAWPWFLGTAFGANGEGSFGQLRDWLRQLIGACDRIEKFVNAATPCPAPSSS